MSETPDRQVGEETDLFELPLLRIHESRRRCPRVDLRVPVTVSTADRAMIRARTRNLGPEGLQFRCTGSAAAVLHRVGRRGAGTKIGSDQGAIIVLRMALPLHGRRHEFIATGRLTYLAARRRDEIAFGVEFIKVQPVYQQTLDAFIVEALRPA